MVWAQKQNVQSSKHFPVIAVSYGYLAVVQTLVRLHESIIEVPLEQRYVSHDINLRLTTDDTYIYDGLDLTTVEDMLDNIQFYNELSFNIRLRTFLKEKQLSRIFVPIATFNQDHVNQEEEFVAMMEGVVFPFFGFAWSIEKVQHNFDLVA